MSDLRSTITAAAATPPILTALEPDRRAALLEALAVEATARGLDGFQPLQVTTLLWAFTAAGSAGGGSGGGAPAGRRTTLRAVVAGARPRPPLLLRMPSFEGARTQIQYAHFVEKINVFSIF